MKHPKKSKTLPAALFAALTVLTLLTAALFSWVFVVRDVAVSGAMPGDESAIIRSARLTMGGSIFKTDARRIADNIESEGRYAVEKVDTELPSTVLLYVRPRTRDAVAQNGGHMLVMDADGYVIEVCDTVPENVGVYVSGLGDTSYKLGCRVTAPEDRLRAMKTVLDAVRTQEAGDYISEIILTDLMNLRAVTRTGIKVNLGNLQNMEQKILWLRTAVADLESRGETRGTLDVSSGMRADYSGEDVSS